MNVSRSSGQRFTSNVIPSLVIGADLICLLVSVPLALIGYAFIIGERIDPQVHLVAAVIAGTAFFLIRQSQSAYAETLAPLEGADRSVVIDYAIGALLSSAILWQLGLIGQFSRALALLYVGICLSLLLVSRYALRAAVARMTRSGRIRQRVVLYGSDPAIVEATCRLLGHQALPQLYLVGVADDRGGEASYGELPFIGGFPQLLEMARAGEIDQVLIALPDINRARLDEILDELSAVSVDVSLVPREAIALAPDYRISFVGTLPILTLWQRPLRDINTVVKAVEDIVIATIALVFLAPLLLVTAIAIKITSPGPVLFVQQRFGFNNKEIAVFKFRSMYVDRQDADGAIRTVRHDDRVTGVGRIIRRLSIDEIPQLLNVMRGEMSIVGPRPHAVYMKVGDLYYFDAVKGYRARHRIRPGITGLAQVRGLRGEIQTLERAKRRVELDQYYIDNWSLGLDLRIILETATNILFDRNAY